MSNPNEEQLFIREALASVEKAARFQNYKAAAMTVVAFIAAFSFAFRPTSPELKIECTILIGLSLVTMICTTKILARIDKNTFAVLQAIADLRQR
jgi:FtsH-binding integral membrane protein